MATYSNVNTVDARRGTEITEFCRECGADVGKDQKNRRSLSGSAVYCTLIPFATSVTDSSSQSIDVSNFENGYACKSCYGEVEKLQKLQKQLGELKESVLTKVTKSAHLFPVTSRGSVSSSTGNAIQTPTRTSS